MNVMRNENEYEYACIAQVLHGAGVDGTVRVEGGRRVGVASVPEQQRATAQMARSVGRRGTHDVRHARAALLVRSLPVLCSYSYVYTARRKAHEAKRREAVRLCAIVLCSVGLLGDCILTTRQQCGLVRGYFHEDAFLCSQVYSLVTVTVPVSVTFMSIRTAVYHTVVMSAFMQVNWFMFMRALCCARRSSA